MRATRLPQAAALQAPQSAMLKVYGFSRVNKVARGNTRDLRILWALEEMQLPHEIIGMDHPANDLTSDAYRDLSPFEQIPAINDDGFVLSESGAILIYLAKQAGKLIPSDPRGEAQVVRWCIAALNTIHRDRRVHHRGHRNDSRPERIGRAARALPSRRRVSRPLPVTSGVARDPRQLLRARRSCLSPTPPTIRRGEASTTSRLLAILRP